MRTRPVRRMKEVCPWLMCVRGCARQWRAKLPGSSRKEGGSNHTFSGQPSAFRVKARSSQPQSAKRPIRKAVA